MAASEAAVRDSEREIGYAVITAPTDGCIGAELNGVQTREARFAATVALVRAIGGSWAAAEVKTSAGKSPRFWWSIQRSACDHGVAAALDQPRIAHRETITRVPAGRASRSSSRAAVVDAPG